MSLRILTLFITSLSFFTLLIAANSIDCGELAIKGPSSRDNRFKNSADTDACYRKDYRSEF